MKPLSGPEEKLLLDTGIEADLEAYLQSLSDVFMTVRGSRHTQFEMQTAKCLFNAYRHSHSPEVAGKFVAVSAATGSGKSIGALAMLLYLSRKGLSGAFIVREISELERYFLLLSQLIPAEDIAVWSSIHNKHARPDVLWKYERDQGVTPSSRFTVANCREARIILTTHRRWESEIDDKADYGVYLCQGERRELVIVDEEPELDRVYPFTAGDINRVATFLSDFKTPGEHGLLGRPIRKMVDTLREIQRRAEKIVDASQKQPMAPCELVTPDDISAINAVSMKEIEQEAWRRGTDVTSMLRLVDGLKVAAQGRLFFARNVDRRGVFYAYGMPLAPQERTVLLDGTADLNEFYTLSRSVHVADAIKPDYRDVQVTHVTPAAPLKGNLRPDAAYRNRSCAQEVMTWLQSFLRQVTTEGEKVLVYAKKDFLDKFSDAEIGKPEKGIVWEGRQLYFVNFGRGRGSSVWKDCTVYVSLGGHYLSKEVLVARLGSFGEANLDKRTLTLLGTPKPNHDVYRAARASFTLVNLKQDAARTAIRNFDDNGVAAAARLYLIDCNRDLLARNLWKLFPGNPGLRLLEEDAGQPVKGKHDKGDLLLSLLLTSQKTVLEGEEILKATGAHKCNLWRVIDRALVDPGSALSQALRGWAKVSRKDVGLKGKGYVLARVP